MVLGFPFVKKIKRGSKRSIAFLVGAVWPEATVRCDS